METIKKNDQGFEDVRQFITVDELKKSGINVSKYKFIALDDTVTKELQRRTFITDKIVITANENTIYYCDKLFRYMTHEEYQKLDK